MTVAGVLILFGWYAVLIIAWSTMRLSAKGDRDNSLRFLLDRSRENRPRRRDHW